jgi:hypothetical protein
MAEKKIKKIEKESDIEFLKRIQSKMADSKSKLKKTTEVFSKEFEEAKASGAKMAATFKELEECKKIVEEFKANPPLITSKSIAGISVEYFYADAEVQKKVDLLKKHFSPFLSAVKRTSIFPIVFSTFGKAYLKRGEKKVTLPESSSVLPFIIKDGDIIGTEGRAFVLELKDEAQNEENDYWHVFIFPNSELKISISESVSHPEPAYMVPSQVPDAVKKRSSSTVYNYKIEKVELLKGLFHLNVQKKGKNVNNLVRFAPGFPEIEFKQGEDLMSETVKELLKKAQASVGDKYPEISAKMMTAMSTPAGRPSAMNAFIELNADRSVVVFGTNSKVIHKNTGASNKKISTDPIHPVKMTFTGSGMYETEGIKNPDGRVAAVMQMWMAISPYIASLKVKNEDAYRETGQSLEIEQAQKMQKYADELGDKDMISAAKIILQRAKNEESSRQSLKAREADKEGQRKEAMEQLKFAEESGEKELIEVAKAQLKSAEGGNPVVGISTEEAYSRRTAMNEEMLNRFRRFVETDLPPYSA